MYVYVNLKKIGKRKNDIKKVKYKLYHNPSTVKELIKEFVTVCVENFNERVENKKILDYLSKEEMDDTSINGKISFNVDYNNNKQSLKKAINNALTSYVDGIFRIFINNQELTKLEEKIKLTKEDTITFVRLTMLSGRIW